MNDDKWREEYEKMKAERDAYKRESERTMAQLLAVVEGLSKFSASFKNYADRMSKRFPVNDEYTG